MLQSLPSDSGDQISVIHIKFSFIFSCEKAGSRTFTSSPLNDLSEARLKLQRFWALNVLYRTFESLLSQGQVFLLPASPFDVFIYYSLKEQFLSYTTSRKARFPLSEVRTRKLFVLNYFSTASRCISTGKINSDYTCLLGLRKKLLILVLN